jgi:hypothetical protein
MMSSMALGRKAGRTGLRVLGCGAALAVLALADGTAGQPDRRPGVDPQSGWTCPLSHPIKGNFTTYSGERCIYHVAGGGFYDKTKPERCYATEAEARADGCRRSRR